MTDQTGDTPEKEKAPSDTPPDGQKAPDPVEELKNQLEREKARAATALKEKDVAEKAARDEKIARINAERKLKAGAGGGSEDGGDGGDNSSTSQEEEMERLNAEKGVANLVMLNPGYRDLMEKDPTLKHILVSNPLALITEYIDAGDAVDQIKKLLDSRISNSTESKDTEKKEPDKKSDVPPVNNTAGSTGSVTMEQAAKMSPAEWAKLPKATRDKILMGGV